jgi:dUTP pyrophosphatase
MPQKTLQVQVKKLHPTATVPTKGTEDSAGWDLYANRKTTINGHHEEVVSTGLAMAIPKGWFGLIKVRSGSGLRLKITENAGVVDSDYRDEVGMVMINISDGPKTIQQGERIAQMVILPVPPSKMVEVDTLDETDRDGGFGSTG